MAATPSATKFATAQTRSANKRDARSESLATFTAKLLACSPPPRSTISAGSDLTDEPARPAAFRAESRTNSFGWTSRYQCRGPRPETYQYQHRIRLARNRRGGKK